MQNLTKAYQDLIVCQRSWDLAVQRKTIKKNLYGLVSQIDRSSASISA
jgi:hypothetical protein